MADVYTPILGGDILGGAVKLKLFNNSSEINPTGDYATGGYTVTGVTYVDAVFDADDMTFNLVTATVDQARYYDHNDFLFLIKDYETDLVVAVPTPVTFTLPVGGVDFSEAAAGTYYYIYPKFLELALTGTMKAMLLTNLASFNAAHDYVADVVAYEVSAVGYARQSVPGTLASDANGVIFTPSAAVEFPAITASVRSVVFYLDSGSGDATSKVFGMMRLQAPTDLVAQSFKLVFSGNLIEGLV